jgi:hypothetical protein
MNNSKTCTGQPPLWTSQYHHPDRIHPRAYSVSFSFCRYRTWLRNLPKTLSARRAPDLILCGKSSIKPAARSTDHARSRLQPAGSAHGMGYLCSVIVALEVVDRFMSAKAWHVRGNAASMLNWLKQRTCWQPCRTSVGFESAALPRLGNRFISARRDHL